MDGIDVNFCKNPRCPNFGIPADVKKFRRKKSSALGTTPGTAYGLTAVGKNRPALNCLLCGETFTLKSNQAVAEELARFSQHLAPPAAVCCATPDCANHTVPVPLNSAYQRFGKTNAGTPRFRCRLCGKTITVGGRALKKQRITHLNKTILLALTNKVPLRRILKINDLNAVTLYGKIDFLHRQCLAYNTEMERKLTAAPIQRLYISADRQEYTINWSRISDRRNVVLRAVGTADMRRPTCAWLGHLCHRS